MQKKYIISVELNEAEALAYAQFLKRIMLTHYVDCAVNIDEARIMYSAGERIRKELAENGFYPR